MKEKNRFFGGVTSVDENLLSLDEANFSVRYRDEQEMLLFSLSGKMLRLSSDLNAQAPNMIVCEKLPSLNEELAEDSWAIKDGILRIPFLTKIDLNLAPKFKSVANIEIRDFPGHMRNLIAHRMRQDDFASLKKLEERVNMLADAIREHLTESAEIPLLDVISFGESKPSPGDAALCGMILTGRCFAIGQRLKVNWYNRLSIETRRLMHRTDVLGKNWLGFALEGRMTKLQNRFFSAMARDFESADEIVVKDVANDASFNGKAFLIGTHAALEMIEKNFFKSQLSD
jgi:hypothetical protein